VYDKGESVYLKGRRVFTVVVGWELSPGIYRYKYVVKGAKGNETVERSDLMSMIEAEKAGHRP
jgi:hypothetical protein